METTLAQQFVQYVHEDLLQIKQPHFDIAFRLKEAKDLNYAEELGFANIYDLAETEFGFKRSSCAAYIAVCENFMDGTHVKECFANFSYSQLCEMLSLSFYDRTLIKPTMTVRQIREWKRDHKFVFADGAYAMYGSLSEKQKQAYENLQEKKKQERKQQREEKFVQTSGQMEVQSEAFPYENLQNFEKNIVVTPVSTVSTRPLLGLKNREQRAEFLDNYKSWGIWLSVPELNLTCYKYKFSNGAEVIVSESSCYSETHISQRGVLRRYHLINDKITFFDLSGIAKTYVLDYMTEYAKEI